MEVLKISEEKTRISRKRTALKTANKEPEKLSKHDGTQSFETGSGKAREQARTMARSRCTKSETLHCSGWPDSGVPQEVILAKEVQSKAFGRETRFACPGHGSDGLEKEVKRLQQNLAREIALRKALERAFNRPLGSLPRVPHFLPSKTQELIAEVAVLEEEIVTLEDQFFALQQYLYNKAAYPSAFQKHKHKPSNHNVLSIQRGKSCCSSKQKPSSSANVSQKRDFVVTKLLSSKMKTHSKERLQSNRSPSSNIQKEHDSENTNARFSSGANAPEVQLLGRTDNSEIARMTASDVAPSSCQSSARQHLNGDKENVKLQEATEMGELNFHPARSEVQGNVAGRNLKKEDLQQSKMLRSSSTADNGGKADSEKLTESLLKCTISSSHIELGNMTLYTKGLPSTLSTKRILSSCLISEPNKLSEEIMKCLLGIYGTMTRPYLVSDSDSFSSLSFSPFSSFSSQSYGSKSSASLKFTVGMSEELKISDPYGVCQTVPHDIGPYKQFQEITAASFDYVRIAECTPNLRRLRDMVAKLAKVDVHGMSHHQKVAFLINIHNACMMHAFLEHGIPCSSYQVITLIHKATLNVGGYLLNIQTIEHMLRLSSNKGIGISKEAAQISSILGLEWTEPHVIFALCSGTRSSPAVRVYTASEIDYELEVAKKDYLQAAIGFSSRQKVLIPRLLGWNTSMFSKDAESPLDWVCQELPKSFQVNLRQFLEKAKLDVSQVMEIMPYDFSFRYLVC